MDDLAEEHSLQIARRQKKLLFSRRWLTKESGLDPQVRNSILERLSTFAQLLGKSGLSVSDAEKVDIEDRIQTIERELNDLIMYRRLLTSDIGIAALGDK